jgi:peptidoglycan hydrolase-like protein with peptidoglycan-binding domain
MTRSQIALTAFALTGFTALAGCSSGGGGLMGSRTSVAAPMPTPASAAAETDNSSSTKQTLELTPALVRRVQMSLRGAGLYRGRLDGVYGPKTAGAVQGYQQAHDLTVSGQLDRPTLAALKLSDATPMPGQAAVTADPVAGAPNAAGSPVAPVVTQ